MMIHFRGRRLRKIKSDHFNHRFYERIGKFSMEKTNGIVMDILNQIENSRGSKVGLGYYKHSVFVLGVPCIVVYDKDKNELKTIWRNV